MSFSTAGASGTQYCFSFRGGDANKRVHCASRIPPETLGPLTENHNDARRQLTPLRWRENVRQAYQPLPCSAAAIIQACQDLLPGLAGYQSLINLVHANL